MRGAWLTLLLLVPLSGCFDFLDVDDGDGGVRPADVIDDPDSYTIVSVTVHEFERGPGGDNRLESADGTKLSAKIYEPITRDARADGTPIQFPVLFLLHPWGFAKEYFENAPMGEPSESDPDPRVNLMQMFAEQGFITVAYDNRGFGRSDGQVTIAGSAEMEDLEAVRQYIDGPAFQDNDRFGVAGVSLGAGTALRAWATNPHIDVAGDIYGWFDLYDAIVPGNVPKAEWGTALFTSGTATTGGDMSPEIRGWLARAVQRQDMTGIEAEMDTRSTRALLSQTDKPLFRCQGLQETLFPQMEIALHETAGFTRALVFTGGHGEQDPVCWDRTLDFMDFFLRGVQNNVPKWPFLETIDSDPEAPVLSLAQTQLDFEAERRYLHDGVLVAGASNSDFTVSQRLLSNPFQEPSVVSDETGRPYEAIPEQLRQDPFAVFFDSGPFDATRVVLGAPTLELVLDAGMNRTDFQVVATLYSISPDGDSRPISRGAYAHVLDQTAAVDQEVIVPMTWTKTTIPADGRLVLKLSANDVGHFLPLQANYDVTFTGHSALDVPYFA